MKVHRVLVYVFLAGALLSCGRSGNNASLTRGLGIYPGRPGECTAPQMKPGGRDLRNLALNRAATHSSAFDYDHTAQLVSDGIVDNDSFPGNFWKSGGAENEWVCVDLGAVSSIRRMVFHWKNAPLSVSVQLSNDGKKWVNLETFRDAELQKRCKARFVRAILDRTADDAPFELKEWEIIGKGGVIPEALPAPERNGNRQELTRGNWKLIRAGLVQEDGEELSTAGFCDTAWLPATVPGTVLTSFVEAGAVLDPGYADNQFFISDSYFNSDFWYRDTFSAHPDSERQFLHFDGINWKAEVYMNGVFLGLIYGAYRTAAFDVTGILKEGDNALAVKVICNENYGAVTEQTAFSSGANGGLLGGDNPTVYASIGWDWVPTVRGRNAGILDDVYLLNSGPVTVEDPFVRSILPLPDTTYADLLLEATLVNHSGHPVSGTLKGRFGELFFECEQSLEAGESRLVRMEPLRLDNPQLWWPNGYGNPHLYDVEFTFEADGAVSDRKEFRSGVRQMDVRFDTTVPDRNGDPSRLNLYVNGKRLVAFGGNWGLPEQLLRYRGREYDIAVRNHADQHFTMIRNWVGMTQDCEFYEACDRYGIVVWQDFWLANPADGPHPRDVTRFNATAEETVRRIRNHPCVGIYVGRNEGYPPEEIDSFLSGMVPRTHPGIFYLSNSADGPVSGRGPYRALPVEDYFTLFGLEKLHSERGMPNVMNYENLCRSLGLENLEPVNTLEHPNPMYGLHDYTLGNVEGATSAQRADTFNTLLEKAFGEPSDAREFSQWAQWINYDGYRAIFESRSAHRQGMLLWMSHPAWPSLVWQTYDYFFEPTAAYFGCKKACEPIHIQWNPVSGQVEVVSWYSASAGDLTAHAELLDFRDGSTLWAHSETVSIGPDQTISCFAVEYPEALPELFFLRLTLTDQAGETVSENFYWRGRLKALLDAGSARVDTSVRTLDREDEYALDVTLENRGKVPAMMVRLKLVDSLGGDLILPVWYTDNYFFLMPGQSKTVTARVRKEDCAGVPELALECFNGIE